MENKGIIKLDLNVTNRCNYRCPHCCFKSGQLAMSEMSLKTLQNLLAEFRDLGGQRIDITGGEPTLRDDILAIMTAAKKLDIKVELVTNGSLLDEKKLRALKDIGLDDIAMSMDGSTHPLYKQIRPISQELFAKVLANIELSAKLGFHTKINTVVFKSNLTDLPNICQLAIELGAQEHGFYFFSPIGRGAEMSDNVADPREWLTVIREKLPTFMDRIKLSLEVPVLERALAEKLETGCFMQNPSHLQILPNGNVFPCAIMCAQDKPLANLYKKTLTQIWDWTDQLFGYHKEHVQPLFDKWQGCVDYPFLNKMLKDGMRFICLCRKFKMEGVMS